MMPEQLVDSPVGQLRITYSQKGIIRVKFNKDEENAQSNDDTKNENVELAIKWFEAYFRDPSETKSMKLPILDLESHQEKTFMCKVWETLRDRVSPGETISYGELAKLCGNPKGARAVGTAMRTNPFTILVPCHRVINANGDIGNYGGGVDKKQWLLQHEGKDFTKTT